MSRPPVPFRPALRGPAGRRSAAWRWRSLLALFVLALVLASVGEAAPQREAPSSRRAGRDVLYPLVFPIAGEFSFVRDFGDPRPGGRSHEGTDILAPKHTPVVAVADGTVRWVHGERGGDCCALSIEHGDGWRSRYIHLNNDTPGTDDGKGWGIAPGIRVGSRVRAGQIVGYVGDSGNAESTTSHLHFELRRPDGTAVNPYASLQAAAAVSVPEIQGPAIRAPRIGLAPDVLRPAPAPDLRRTPPPAPEETLPDELAELLDAGAQGEGPLADGGRPEGVEPAEGGTVARPVTPFLPAPRDGCPLVEGVTRARPVPRIEPPPPPTLACWGGGEAPTV